MHCVCFIIRCLRTIICHYLQMEKKADMYLVSYLVCNTHHNIIFVILNICYYYFRDFFHETELPNLKTTVRL